MWRKDACSVVRWLYLVDSPCSPVLLGVRGTARLMV